MSIKVGRLQTHAWSTGKINSGLSFNGTSNYVSMGTPTGLQFASASSITTISWFKTTSTTFFMRMMSEGVGNWNGGFMLDINAVCTGCVGGFTGTVNGTATYTLPIAITYQLTPTPGWSLTITSTTLTSGSNTLPTTASKITSVANTCTSTCTPTTMTNTISSFPITVPAGTTAPTAVKFFGTAAGTGTGAYTVTPTISVAIPITAKTGAYSSTVTLTVATGP